jgi:hypothetical protein
MHTQIYKYMTAAAHCCVNLCSARRRAQRLVMQAALQRGLRQLQRKVLISSWRIEEYVYTYLKDS